MPCKIATLAAALALWRDFGWRVSVPLAAAGYVLAQSHFPPYGAVAGLALGIAVWQYLMLERRVSVESQKSTVDSLAGARTK